MAGSNSASSEAVFQQSPDPQISSALLSITPELRAKILRYVLKPCDPLISHTELLANFKDFKDSKKEEGSSTRKSSVREKAIFETTLDPQVLTTCQQLYNEGSLILYGENVLSIYIYGLRISFLDTSICFHSILVAQKLSAQIQLGRLLLDFKTNWKISRELGRNFTMKRTASNVIPSPRNFGRFRLLIQIFSERNNSQEVFYACRILRPLLQGKQVTIKFAHSKGTEKIFIEPASAYLTACGDLRCQSLWFDWAETVISRRVTNMITGADKSEESLRVFEDMVETLQYSSNCFSVTELIDSLPGILLDNFIHARDHEQDAVRVQVLALMTRAIPKRCNSLMGPANEEHEKRVKSIKEMHKKQLGMLAMQKEHPRYSIRVKLVNTANAKRTEESDAQTLRVVHKSENARDEVLRKPRSILEPMEARRGCT